MTVMDDHVLLEEYARNGSETAFAALVERHAGLVYSAARRQLHDDQHAEDVTQAVFLVLAKNARKLSRHPGLTGWLLQTSRYAVNAHIRQAVRRTRREQEAAMQSAPDDSSPAAWSQLEPLLDEAMATLGDTDRTILAWRYFENRTVAEISQALRLNEAAAHKRSARALEKLRRYFTKKGIALSAAALAGIISAHSVQAAPAGLAAKISVTAAKGAATTAAMTALVKGTMKTMTGIKLKSAAAISAFVLVTGGLVTVALSGEKPPPLPADPVAFFKQALSSPPGIDSFVAGQRSLRPAAEQAQIEQMIARSTGKGTPTGSPEILANARRAQPEQYYAGARAGSDYYLRHVSSPSTPNIPAENQIIIGRAGPVLYQVGRNNVTYGSGTNAFVTGVDIQFHLVRQLLDLGLADVEPESVVWTGNEFTARNGSGTSRYGALEVSNSLPFALNVSVQKNSPAFERIEYQYPDPPASLGGFPARMTMFDATEGGFKPDLAITLYSVHLADRRLAHDFFSDNQFKTEKIIYTNAYINSEVWGTVNKLNGKSYYTNISHIKAVHPQNQPPAK